MSIKTTTHLNFSGNAKEALTFYQSVFGGELKIATYGDFGMPQEAPGADKIVFAELSSEQGFHVMAYDIPGASGSDVHVDEAPTRRENGVTLTSQKFFLSVRGETLEEITEYWEQLAQGATVIEQLAASAWSPGFGMLTDRFDVTWILDVA